MKSPTSRPRLVSLLSCVALILSIQAPPVYSDIIQSPDRHLPYFNNIETPGSPAPTLVTAETVELLPTLPSAATIRKSSYPIDFTAALDDDRVKQILQRRAPGDDEPHQDITHSEDGTGIDTGTGAGNGGSTTVTSEEEEAAKKKAEEEAAKKAAEEEAARKKAEEEEAAKKAAEEEAARKAAEEEAAKKAAEEEAAKKAAEEEEARKKAEEEEARKKTEEEARKKAEEEEAARKKAEEEAAKKNQEKAEREAARKAAEEAEAARKAKEEADKKAAVEEAARKAREEAERNKNKDQDNKETSGGKGNDQALGNKDNRVPDPSDDYMTTDKDESSESTKKTIMIGSISGGAALVALVVAGFLIRHKRDARRRASAMEAYLSKKVELQSMGGDSNQSSTSFSRHNSSNNGGAHVSRGGSSGQGVYNQRSNSRYARSQQHLTHPSPLHLHATQHYDDQNYDASSMGLPAMPTLISTGVDSPSGGIEGSDHYYPQYHYEDYHAASPVLVSNRLASQDQYDQYYQQQGHDYYSQQQQEYDGYYDQEMYSSGIATETAARSAATYVDFPLPPSASLAVETTSKEPHSSAEAAIPNPTVLTSLPPRDPHALTYSVSTASSSASLAMSSASAGTRSAKGPSKRSPVAALIASETGGDDRGSEGSGGQRTLRRSGSVLFG
ncbi:hypothetical protein EC991_006307 [Linnemannia zychae]|nr:hypothetical protein EC991_006307 [Linnemannia zychae]